MPRGRCAIALGLYFSTLTLFAAAGLKSPVAVQTTAVTAPAANWRQLGTTTLSERQHSSIGFYSATSQLIVFGGDNSIGVLNDTWSFDGTRWNRLQPPQSPPPRTSASLIYDPDTKTLILFGGDTHTTPNGLLADTWSFDGNTWTQLQTQHQPPPRYDAAMAYDPVYHEIVLYGGLGDNGFLDDIWTFDGTDWTDRSSASDPPARHGAGMVYDSISGDVILFGGLGFTPAGTTTYLAETWSWKNRQWTRLSPATSPPGRWEPAMSENTSGGVTLFGGYADDGLPHGSSTKFSDTWTWNGTTWSQSSATGPGGRYGGTMTKDPALGALALVGGCCNSVGGFYTDTWTFDGKAWTARARTDAPSVRQGAVMINDVDRAQAILFGGFGGDGFLSDTWIEKGGKWSQLTTATAPAGRFASNLSYDSLHHVGVLFGGQSGPNSGCSTTPDALNPNHLCDDTWTFNGGAWARQTAAKSPPYRSLAAMAFDPDTNQTVLFGGFSDQNTLSDTWTWDGMTWTQQSPAHSPPGEPGAAPGLEAAVLAWDALHHQLILFGGEGNGANGPKIFNETWIWTGSDWQQLHPANSPPPLRAANLVFDRQAGGLLLVAGQGSGPGTFGTYSDTWLWDGTNWNKLQPANLPPPRYFASAAFDSILQSTILFGGGGDDGFLDDTWAFGNGSNAVPTATPAVVASTYLGGSGFEITWQCATDVNGNVYIAGDAQAADFPVTSNAFQKKYGDGGQDGFVAKFDNKGNLLWSTYLGGSGWDGVFGLAVDAAGNAVVTGVTESSDFPITANAVQRTVTGDAAFVTVISADGTQVLYSTVLGGTQSDGGVPLPTNPFHALPNANVETIGVGIAIGNDGTLYVVGETNTIDMPVTQGAAQSVIGGEVDGFVARIDINKAGAAGLVYSTYLGGALGDFCAAVTVDPSGNAFVTGETQSPNFPTTLGAFQRIYSRGTAAFVAKIDPTGSSLIYSTLISGTQGGSASGGTNYNAPSAIAIDSDGHAFVAGETNATDFPTTAGVVQPTLAGQDDGFVTELWADGSSLVFSTYLGASDYEGLFGLKLDSAGNIFVDGYTSSRDLPLVRPFQSNFGGFIDAWVAELSPGGTALLLSSYLGGSDQESAYGLDLWNGQLYVAGRTASKDFPITSSAVQTTYGGGVWDNFLTIINPSPTTLASAVSRKTHGSAGTFDVDLPLTGTPGVECRSGGADGNYTVVLTFANTLTSVQSAVVTGGGGSVSNVQIDSDAHNVIVSLTGVGNAQTINVSLSNVTDSAGNFSSGVSVPMSVLVGDTTGNGQVNSSDIAQTQSQSGQPVTAVNFREDVTANGVINSSDIALVQSKSGTALPQSSSGHVSQQSLPKQRPAKLRSHR